jgi:hypothetical protein
LTHGLGYLFIAIRRQGLIADELVQGTENPELSRIHCSACLDMAHLAAKIRSANFVANVTIGGHPRVLPPAWIVFLQGL